jgi:hypothetical protein
MLCFEGIAQALNIFRGKAELPNLRLAKVPENKMQTLTVSKETARIRPYVAGAILRDIKFTQDTYDSLYVHGHTFSGFVIVRWAPAYSRVAASRCKTNYTKIWPEIERWYP